MLYCICIAKLPDEVCVSHTKRVGENETVLQLKQLPEMLLTGLTFKKMGERFPRSSNLEMVYPRATPSAPGSSRSA